MRACDGICAAACISCGEISGIASMRSAPAGLAGLRECCAPEVVVPRHDRPIDLKGSRGAAGLGYHPHRRRLRAELLLVGLIANGEIENAIATADAILCDLLEHQR